MNTTRIGPILFSTPMVQAIMREANPKTQTRRVILPQPSGGYRAERNDDGTFDIICGKIEPGACYDWAETYWPKHREGDILWVRETWAKYGSKYYFRADANHEGSPAYNNEHFNTFLGWKPSIFMPKKACRLWLRVKAVRVERVQEISEADSKAEGVEAMPGYCNGMPAPQYGSSYRIGYSILWDSINAKRGFGWEKNPWVWVYTFERTAKPEGWPEASSPQHGGTYREGGA